MLARSRVLLDIGIVTPCNGRGRTHSSHGTIKSAVGLVPMRRLPAHREAHDIT